MTTPPAQIPDWLMQMQKDVGQIEDLKKGQESMAKEVKEIKREMTEAVKEAAILEAQVQDHIKSDHLHLTREDVEDEVDEELEKRGLKRLGQVAADHPILATGGVMTPILVLFEIIRGMM